MSKRSRPSLLLLPLLDLALLIPLGFVIGGFATFLYVLGSGIVGAWLLNRSLRGRPGAAMGRLHPMLGGTAPLSAILLMLPGVCSTLLAAALLIPGVRRFLLRKVQAYVMQRLQRAAFKGMGLDGSGFGAADFGDSAFGDSAFGNSAFDGAGFGSVGPDAGPGDSDASADPAGPSPGNGHATTLIVEAEVTEIRENP